MFSNFYNDIECLAFLIEYNMIKKSVGLFLRVNGLFLLGNQVVNGRPERPKAFCRRAMCLTTVGRVQWMGRG